MGKPQRRGGKGGKVSEKRRKLHRFYDFFVMRKTIKLNCFILSTSMFLHRLIDIEKQRMQFLTRLTIHETIEKGNWKIFILKMRKFFSFFFLLKNTHLRWDGKLITAKVRFRLDDDEVCGFFVWKNSMEMFFSSLRKIKKIFQTRWKMQSEVGRWFFVWKFEGIVVGGIDKNLLFLSMFVSSLYY